jgi:hypothetical protein
MIRTHLQISGSHLIVGLEGKNRDIVNEFHSYQTFGAAYAPHFLSDRFLYFWTDYASLLEAIEKKLEARTYNETGIQFEGQEFKTIIKTWAIFLFEKINRTQFLETSSSLEEFQLTYEDTNTTPTNEPS